MAEETPRNPRISGITTIIIITLLLSSSYYFGIVEGKNNGKIELCESMGGFYGFDDKTDIKGCFNTSLLESKPNYDFPNKEVLMEEID